MSAAIADEPRILSTIPGRLRLHLPEGAAETRRAVERRLRALPGTREVRGSDATGNVLVLYDPSMTGERTILDVARAIAGEPIPAGAASAPSAQQRSAPGGSTADLGPSAQQHKARHLAHTAVSRNTHEGTTRARIAVPGIDRNPQLAQRVAQHIASQPGVKRAVASPLTGRLLVEYTHHETDIDDLITQIVGMDLPDLPEEDTPTHPLDPAPLIQSAARTAGAVIGFGLIGAKRVTGTQDLGISQAVAGQVANVLGILRGFPFIRNGARRIFGRNAGDLVLTLPTLLTLALSDNPLGLAVTGAEALRLLTEVMERQRAWRRYEARLSGVAGATPGAVIRVETGERVPLAGIVHAGTGTATDRHGLPEPVAPGGTIAAGSRLYGGPFVIELKAGKAFTPQPRPVPLRKNLYDRYIQVVAPLSLAYGALTGLVTLSVSRALQALVLVSPRTAVIGMEAANQDAAARVLRAGVTVVATRPDRTIRRPDALLLDGARLLTDGFELTSVLPLREGTETTEIVARAAAIASAAGSPWGGAFRAANTEAAEDGDFDGTTATARVSGERYFLGPVEDSASLPSAVRLRERGNYLILLRGETMGRLGLFVLRPRLAQGIAELMQTCQRYHVEIGLLGDDDSLPDRETARRTGISIISEDVIEAIRARQADGGFVALASDSADAAEAFAACDLAIGVLESHSPLPARADLLAPDLPALAAIVEAGAQRDAAVRDSVGFSTLSNIGGAAWGLQGPTGFVTATQGMYGTALAALVDGWLRTRGGERPMSLLDGIVDPHPERWGHESIETVLRTLDTTDSGLTSAAAAKRRRVAAPPVRRSAFVSALLEQAKSPLTLLLAGAAGVSLFLGSPGNAAIIGATVAANSLVSAWQVRQVGRAVQSLERMSATVCRVLRDGQLVQIAAPELVPGDVLLLASGDHIAADARLLEAHHLEVDEAPLTGESLPVRKAPDAGSDANRIVLDGSDVTTGNGRAVVVAVGHQTRMGATAAALATEDTRQSPLGQRLGAMLRQTLPLAAAAGLIVTASGVVRGRPLLPQAAIGATLAVAAIPEGLPILAQLGEAGVARRLATRNALVRQLSSIEALGRVDIACTDKTGTLTEGHLSVTLVADAEAEAHVPGPLSESLRHVLLTAALASPHPDDPGAGAHPTDVAVVRGAREVGIEGVLYAQREAESPFDPVRAFHAALVDGRLAVKGAPEAVLPRCTTTRRHGDIVPLDDAERADWEERARALAARGLRVLLAAERPVGSPVTDPHSLTALGFIGISDPLRPTVRAAVRTCSEAGIRVLMLTGDHPATARAIAREAGLLSSGYEVLTGEEIAALHNGELDDRLERAAVIARATPLDKVRIVESLQRRGHTVAMTGDGVNDAPALRLADVGVAMGRAGTEVARQTADVVLVDDDFATLVQALVEGRSYWRNVRRALGLLVGGNLGELGLVVGASLLGLASPLTARQVLGVNLITDVLPGLAVSLQQPEHNELTGLAREGTAALGRPLRNDILRRAGTTAAPSLAAYLLSLATGNAAQAGSIAFASIVTTQLAQTLDAARTPNGMNRPMVGAVGGSVGLLGAAVALPPLRDFLGLTLPTPFGWALVGASTLASLALHRVFAPLPASLPPRAPVRLLPAPQV